MKNAIDRLLYLRKEVDQIIDNCITEEVLCGQEVDTDRLLESLVYHIEDNLDFLKQGR